MTKNPGGSGTPGVTREFIGMDSPTARRAGSGGHPCQGIYYRGVGRKPKVAMIATHYQIDFSEHYLADYMATRGIGFLGWNTRFRGHESSFLLDHALVDVGVGIQWLRDVQGVETIVLLGNSGGGSLMAAYQAQAVDPHVTPLEGMRPAAGLGDLIPADGYVASAAHPGRPDVLTAWMDGSVVDELDAVTSAPTLDLFDEHHGPPYSPEFVERYRAAQLDRIARIDEQARRYVAEALQARKASRSGSGSAAARRRAGTARVITVWRTDADLRAMDQSLDKSDRGYGSVYGAKPEVTNYGIVGFGRLTTPDAWLSTWSALSSNATINKAGPDMTLPSLLVTYTADNCVFPSDFEAIVAAVGRSDKRIDSIAADHYGNPHYGNPVDGGARDGAAALLDAWMRELN